jgi:hypothetical protein
LPIEPGGPGRVAGQRRGVIVNDLLMDRTLVQQFVRAPNSVLEHDLGTS